MLALALAASLLAPSPQPATATVAGLLAPRTTCRGQANVTAAPAVQVRALRCLVNWSRAHAGLGMLGDDSELDRSASMRAHDIARCHDFSHTPCGQAFVEVFTAVGYLVGAASVGETLAWGQGRLGSPRRAMASWLASPEHRRILLTAKWRDLGLARVGGASVAGYAGVTVWVAQFGRKGLTPLPAPHIA